MTRLKYLLAFLLVTCLYAQTGARYLVITPDAFSSSLQPLIEWKYKKGMKPAVYTLSQIGSDSTSIKNFIVNAYNTWDIQPEYVVLVGHPGYIPMCYYQYAGYGYYTDNYYTNITGSLYNEILPGRLSVSSTAELATVINKVMQYERFPNTADPDWFLRGVAMANCDGSDDSTYLYCMRYAESLAVQNGFTHVDTFSNYYGNNASQVINAINQGRMFVLYRGNANNHWYNPFDVNPYSTSNGTKLPIILSTTCRTVSPSASPILGENFLRVGSSTSPRGAVGFIGGTRNTGNAAHLRNAVAIGCLDALFIYGQYTLGAVTESGRARVYQQYGELREYNNFTCLGDPELNVWTDTPCSLTVVHPEFASYGSANIAVAVYEASGGTPVSDAFVCIAGKADSGVYVLDTTDASGEVLFDLSPVVLGDTLYVTVTGRNLRPYEGSMEVRLLNYGYVIYQKSSVLDTTGNDDGKINPTEEIEMPLWVENIGESTAVQITGALTSNDMYITLIDSMKDFGDIPGRDSVYTGEDGYAFAVPYGCPDNHSITFTLTCADINDSIWVSQFSKHVYAPVLYRDMVTVQGGNGNGIVDPGETLSVFVTLGNQGSTAADDVEGTLRSEEDDVIVLDSTGYFGHIGIDSLITNNDSFCIYVDTTVATGTTILFSMPVVSNYCTDTFMISLVVGNKHYFLWNPDPSPSSGELIHAVLGNLGYSGDYGTALPASLAQYRSLIVCLGVYSNRYLITQGSAEAVQITDYLNSGGRVYIEGSSVWFVDPSYFSGHNFSQEFGINGIDWSYGDLGPVDGQSGTFTVSMAYDYTGENAYMDRLSPVNGGYIIFRDANNYYNCGIARDAGNYRTVGMSFELGGLVDGSPPSTRSALVDSIMKFFGVNGPGVEEENSGPIIVRGDFGIQYITPNPFRNEARIAYSVGRNAQEALIEIYDVAGRLVKSFRLTHDVLLTTQITWNGRDDQNRVVGAGVYFVQLQYEGLTDVKKIILIQ
jgi:hypothetical protein